MFIHTNQLLITSFYIKKYLFFAELAMSQRRSAIFCATGAWGVNRSGAWGLTGRFGSRFTGHMIISGRQGSNLKTSQNQTNDTSKWSSWCQLFKNANYRAIQGHWRSKIPKKRPFWTLAFLKTFDCERKRVLKKYSVFSIFVIFLFLLSSATQWP